MTRTLTLNAIQVQHYTVSDDGQTMYAHYVVGTTDGELFMPVQGAAVDAIASYTMADATTYLEVKNALFGAMLAQEGLALASGDHVFKADGSLAV